LEFIFQINHFIEQKSNASKVAGKPRVEGRNTRSEGKCGTKGELSGINPIFTAMKKTI
jgi:hypothetical protein